MNNQKNIIARRTATESHVDSTLYIFFDYRFAYRSGNRDRISRFNIIIVIRITFSKFLADLLFRKPITNHILYHGFLLSVNLIICKLTTSSCRLKSVRQMRKFLIAKLKIGDWLFGKLKFFVRHSMTHLGPRILLYSRNSQRFVFKLGFQF